jgi:hypothetical protein
MKCTLYVPMHACLQVADHGMQEMSDLNDSVARL